MMKRWFRIFALVTLLIFVDVSRAQGASLPDAAYISGLSGHAQGYSLSCEARSAVDLAAFWGLSIGETEFLQALPYADNPEKGFVGNPNEAWGFLPPHGYGVHATPVAETLQAYGLQAIGLSNLSWDDLRGEINAGHPVIIWIIGDMWEGTPVEYEASDGSTAIVAAYEHTMILTGYNQDTVQVVDAYSGQYKTYALKTFLKSWAVLGNMAVFGSREVTDQESAPAEAHEESYTVQAGEYLIELAKRFGTTWNELAELNSIGYPYIIYPGQELRLPGGLEQVAESEPAPESAQPAPTSEVINYTTCLPMVQQGYVAPSAPSINTTPVSPEPTQPVIVVSSNSLPDVEQSMAVDLGLLEKLKNLVLPLLIQTGQFLKLN